MSVAPFGYWVHQGRAQSPATVRPPSARGCGRFLLLLHQGEEVVGDALKMVLQPFDRTIDVACLQEAENLLMVAIPGRTNVAVVFAALQPITTGVLAQPLDRGHEAWVVLAVVQEPEKVVALVQELGPVLNL